MAQRIDADRVIRLAGRGAPVIDVLPASIYAQEHLPGAVNVPLETFRAEAVEQFDRSKPVVLYCFDQRCDLSSRTAARLEAEGFTDVYDLAGGRATWTALGLPTEGTVADRRRIAEFVAPVAIVSFRATMADVRALKPRYPVAVVDDAGVLLGSLSENAAGLPDDTPVARAMVPAPATLRGDQRVEDVVQQLLKDGLARAYITTTSGALMGIVRFAELHG